MTRRHEKPTSRRHIQIFDEDWEFLEANMGPESASPLGVGTAIRMIVHAKVQGLRAKIIGALDAKTPGEDDREAKMAERMTQS
jgi:hypothetical protein